MKKKGLNKISKNLFLLKIFILFITNQSMGEFKTIRNDPPLPCYISKPKGNGPFPTIFVFMHAPGVDASQQKVCDDLASQGYFALCYDAYLDGRYNFETRTDKLIFDGFEYTLNYAKNLPEVDTNRMGLIGFCMGGRHAYLANVRYPEFNSVVSYYGFPHRGDGDNSTPMKLIDRFHAPVLSIFGEEDKINPLDIVKTYEELSTKSSSKNKTILYPGVAHGFLAKNDNKEISEKAWTETINFFKQYI